jgi:hypothetical protein
VGTNGALGTRCNESCANGNFIRCGWPPNILVKRSKAKQSKAKHSTSDNGTASSRKSLGEAINRDGNFEQIAVLAMLFHIDFSTNVTLGFCERLAFRTAGLRR